MPDSIPTTSRLLSRTQLLTHKGIAFANSTLLRKERVGAFPKRFYLSPRLAVWTESEVDAWVAACRTTGAAAPDTHTLTAARMAKRRERVGT